MYIMMNSGELEVITEGTAITYGTFNIDTIVHLCIDPTSSTRSFICFTQSLLMRAHIINQMRWWAALRGSRRTSKKLSREYLKNMDDAIVCPGQ